MAVLELFLALGTQWRAIGTFGGVRYLGLDYAAVSACLRERRLPRAEFARLFEELREMERAALPLMNRTDG